MTVFVELAVGESAGQVSVSAADAIARVAQSVNASGIRLVDEVDSLRTIDSSIVGSYLAGRYGHLGYLIDARTTHNAPYNLARRVLSLDRATDGRVGVVLAPGEGDEVSDATTPDPQASDTSERWVEYADIVSRLWESFPRAALLGDQERATFVDDTLIAPINHEGRFYRVAGPLDGPASVQGRPVVVAADPDALGWSRIAAVADVVIVERNNIDGADAALSGALHSVGRRRSDVALLARLTGAVSAVELKQWAPDNGVDGFVLATSGRDEAAIVDLVRDVVPQLAGPIGRTLRSTLALRESAEVFA
ncbi:LLM class flavin-dependent oxidoreductase [Rhodococcus globerulus]|uniref:LLM class flavin-dependent oxidoreductase n=1 Tax=Rhodococcus globerulus TaxID=33008 RepID=A0ABU4BMH0_RHOGO|nr:LLM class flavin-dependent oxidoreductase [Rhodococcus globerulus]MDV6265405.1 LLM class flavin-dependent oxidoreductase [Rhodococcus globerulus]